MGSQGAEKGTTRTGARERRAPLQPFSNKFTLPRVHNELFKRVQQDDCKKLLAGAQLEQFIAIPWVQRRKEISVNEMKVFLDSWDGETRVSTLFGKQCVLDV